MEFDKKRYCGKCGAVWKSGETCGKCGAGIRASCFRLIGKKSEDTYPQPLYHELEEDFWQDQKLSFRNDIYYYLWAVWESLGAPTAGEALQYCSNCFARCSGGKYCRRCGASLSASFRSFRVLDYRNTAFIYGPPPVDISCPNCGAVSIAWLSGKFYCAECGQVVNVPDSDFMFSPF